MRRTTLLVDAAALLTLTLVPLHAAAEPPTGTAPVPETVETRPVSVPPSFETVSVPHGRDAADDVAIWIDWETPERSTVIGTDKKGGIAVYDLQGSQIQYLGGDRINNVDVRYGFPFGGKFITLVTAGNRTRETVTAYRVNPRTRHLERIGDVAIGIYPVGYCMYYSKALKEFYGFVNSYEGAVEQWRFFDGDDGKVEGELVRSFEVTHPTPEQIEEKGFSATEGCVADDESGFLYIGEEDFAIWKYHADPGVDDDWRVKVQPVGPELRLTPDVEGLAIYHASDGRGYLIVSNQEKDEFVLYRLEGDHEYVGSFVVEAGKHVDGVTHTDGIEVTNANLGPAFPFGLFVAQDDDNRPQRQNFKLVSWYAIANAFDPPLELDTTWNPDLTDPPALPTLWEKIRRFFGGGD